MPEAPRDRGFADEIGRARRGDRAALDRLLRRIETRLLRRAETRLGPGLRARMGRSDILQATYLEVIRGLDGFDGATEDAFLAWTESVLENAVRHQHRWFRARKRKGPSGSSPAEALARELKRDTPTPSAEAVRAEDLVLAGRALEALPEDQRRVIVLCVVEGRSHREAGEALGRSEGATRMLLFRARAALALEVRRLERGRTRSGQD